MYVLFNRDMELLCDETVVRRSGERRQEYALTLLSLAECRNIGFQTGLGFGKNAVKERIVAVMTLKKTTFASILAAVIALTSALTVFITNAADHTRDETETAAAGEYVVQDTPEWVSVTWEETPAGAETAYTTVAYTMDEKRSDSIVQAQEAVSAEFAEDAVYETTELDGGMEETIYGLIGEFEVYGLSGEVNGDDYQLYYKGEPVYFFADNQNQSGDGFRGRVFAKAAGTENGNTGVITKYDDNGVIIGLVQLSEKDSKVYSHSYW